MIRVQLPAHLRTLAGVDDEVELEVADTVTQASILDALEAAYPALRGTIREHGTLKRRAFVRFFACSEDVSHDAPDAPLPSAIATGEEPFMIVGAIAGGNGIESEGLSSVRAGEPGFQSARIMRGQEKNNEQI